MELSDAGNYEAPSYGYIPEEPHKSEVTNKGLKKFRDSPSRSKKLFPLAVPVAVKVACLALLIAILIIVAYQAHNVNGMLKMSQQPSESAVSLIPNQTTKPAEENIDDCYNEEKSSLCRECSADERCINGCHEETLSVPACLANQRESCHLVQEYSNVHHYFTPAGFPDGSDSGMIQFVAYFKKRADMGICIQFSSNTNAHNGADGCNRWFVMFNGSECVNPTTIEMIDYSATPQLLNRNMEMDGICYGIPIGIVNVEIWIDSCAGFTSSNGLTAWLGSRQLTIMEIFPLKSDRDSAKKPCPGLSHFNLHYETWVQSGEVTFNTSETTVSVRATVYHKLADESSLRIKYQAPLATLVDSPSELAFCARWFVEINGSRCSPEADIIVHPHRPNIYDYYKYHSRTRTLECICENSMPTGPVLVEIKIGKCSIPYAEPNHVKYGDLYRPSRLFIEEVRLKTSLDASLGTDKQLYRSAIMNIARFHWYPLNIYVDDGDIVTVTYTKRFSSTALKLTSSGDHRTIGPGCARWYFKINGTECRNPGAIDAVSADFYPPNVHIPMQTTGNCYGLPAGAYNITYSAGACPGYGVVDPHTGWGSAFDIFIEEVRLDFKNTCYGVPANCN